MSQSKLKTPGVYVTESNAFPPSIVGVQTAVPAFIGYTEKAEIEGKSVLFKPVAIQSMADFESIFGARPKAIYDLVQVTDEQKIANEQYDFVALTPDLDSKGAPTEHPSVHCYSVTSTAPCRFMLYDSMRLFYNNGGGNCYIVSVGNFDELRIEKSALLKGLDAISQQTGPTMLVIPDAVSLPADVAPAPAWQSSQFQNVVQAMIRQCDTLQDRVAILDVYGSLFVNNDKTLDDVIQQFRQNVSDLGKSNGMAYFPFLNTTLSSWTDFDFTNIDAKDGGNAKPSSQETLRQILTIENNNLYQGDQRTTVQSYIDAIGKGGQDEKKLNQQLGNALQLYRDIMNVIAPKEQVLPPSGAMAGVYTYNDANRGVWNAPANIGLSSVTGSTFRLSNDQQGNLNMPLDGKAVNAIRDFVGRGSVVWGARTLDGNSNDWRYIQVRRTIIYIEQSIKNALNQFVFAANDGQTWVTVVSMISSFLQGLWSQGGLMGDKASDAFTVQAGLGSTMTPQDILDGYMIVQVTLQMIRPAEFIELTFKQKMEGVA